MKVCVIGGGSTYTPELVEGLLDRADRIGLTELHLADVDERRLAVLGPLALRMAERADRGVRVHWGTDRRAAIAGARFVISQIRVGQMAARERDEQLGREFGLVGQETVGVGGIANALRTIPVALAICDDIAELAPGATLLNFTNPAGLVTEALCRHTSVPTVGLCNVPWSVKARLARWFEVEPARITLDYVGLNHLSWVRGVTVDGADRTPEALARFRAGAGRAPAHGTEPAWAPETLDLIDAIPNPYLRYYYDTPAWLRRQESAPTRASEVAAIEHRLLEQYADPALDRKPPELALRGGAHYSEAAAELIADLVSGAGDEHVVNVPTAGAVPGLPADVVMEISARVGADGVEPIPVPPLSTEVEALVRTVKASELLTVEAAVAGDEAAAVQALAVNPLGPSLTDAPAVWRRLRELNAGWLGRLG